MNLHAFLVLAVCVLYAWAVEEIMFSQPSSLDAAFPDGVANQKALFGVRRDSLTVSGILVAAPQGNEELCADVKTLPKSFPDKSDTFLILIDRGNCTFVDKALRAQKLGASGVIFRNSDNGMLPYLKDDGKGNLVNIPSLIVSRGNGSIIKGYLDERKRVFVTLRWGFPHSDDTVRWTMWTTPDDAVMSQIKSTFPTVVKAFGSRRLLFRPRYVINNGSARGCTPQDCIDQCTNQGRYCAFGFFSSGTFIVQESLRQICVYEHSISDAKGASPEQWWWYVKAFQSACLGKKETEACSIEQMNKVKIDSKAVLKCMSDAGGVGENDKVNRLLEREIRDHTLRAIDTLPTNLIDDYEYPGSFECPLPVETGTCPIIPAICSRFMDGKAPDACAPNENCPIGQSMDSCGVCYPPNDRKRATSASQCHKHHSHPKASVGTVVGFIVLFGGLALGVFIYFYRRSQARLKNQIAHIMQDYAPLDAGIDTSRVPFAHDGRSVYQ